LAHPRPFLPAGDLHGLLAALAELAKEEGIEVFVVGLPRSMDGSERTSARRVRRFALELKKATGVRVELVDERLSTVEARGRLRAQGLDERRQRGRIDSAAAAILLQSFLDAQRGPDE
jgi:putative Holliday junction resolvase